MLEIREDDFSWQLISIDHPSFFVRVAPPELINGHLVFSDFLFGSAPERLHSMAMEMVHKKFAIFRTKVTLEFTNIVPSAGGKTYNEDNEFARARHSEFAFLIDKFLKGNHLKIGEEKIVLMGGKFHSVFDLVSVDQVEEFYVSESI